MPFKAMVLVFDEKTGKEEWKEYDIIGEKMPSECNDDDQHSDEVDFSDLFYQTK